jgi:hypothetical protein
MCDERVGWDFFSLSNNREMSIRKCSRTLKALWGSSSEKKEEKKKVEYNKDDWIVLDPSSFSLSPSPPCKQTTTRKEEDGAPFLSLLEGQRIPSNLFLFHTRPCPPSFSLLVFVAHVRARGEREQLNRCTSLLLDGTPLHGI